MFSCTRLQQPPARSAAAAQAPACRRPCGAAVTLLSVIQVIHGGLQEALEQLAEEEARLGTAAQELDEQSSETDDRLRRKQAEFERVERRALQVGHRAS